MQLNLKQEVCEDSGGASFFLSLGVNLLNGRLHISQNYGHLGEHSIKM